MSQTLNTFQKDVLNKPDFIKDIVQAFIPDFDLNKKIKVYPKHDWIIIETNFIRIGIEFENCFIGMGHKLKDFKNCRKHSNFRVWEFADPFDDYFEFHKKPNKHHIKMIFNKHKIKKPTASEMYNFYYKN